MSIFEICITDLRDLIDGHSFIRLTVEAEDEDRANTCGLFAATWLNGRLNWIEPHVPPHVHVHISSSDCDGPHENWYTRDVPHDHDDPESWYVDYLRGMCPTWREGFDFRRHSSGDKTYVTISYNHDEGSTCKTFQLCLDGMCDEYENRGQRDVFAERMGY